MMAELRTQLPSWSAQLRIALTLLLPAVASLQTLHSPTSPTAPLPAPKLTVSPAHPVYITGEVVTLTCSAVAASTVSGIRFYQGRQEIGSKEGFSPSDSYIHKIQLSPVSELHAGVYSCQYWEDASGQEIPSDSSQSISIAVTAHPPASTLTVIPQHRIFIVGESVTLTCSAPSTSTLSGIRFFRDSQTIQSMQYPRALTGYTDMLQLPEVSESQAGAYSCEYWKNEYGREIHSGSSQHISIAVTARPSAPTLTLSPQHEIFISGESMTLTCSAPSTSTLSAIRFFKDNQEIESRELPRSAASYSVTLQLPVVSGSHSGAYNCEYWTNVNGREILSQRSKIISIRVTTRPSAPKLTVSPQHQIFIMGESVTLTCSAPIMSTLSETWFFRNSQKIPSWNLRWSPASYNDTLQLPEVSGSYTGEFSCEYWKTESGCEIVSERSQTIYITVTARPPAPKLTVTPQHQIFISGESVTLTCSAPSTSTLSGIRFFRDSQKIPPRDIRWSPASYTNTLQLPEVSGSHIGAYSCEYWKSESGREIPSERSQPISIAVTARPSVPTLTLSPPHQIFIVGESVTLTCSAPSTSTLSWVWFFKDNQAIESRELPWSVVSYSVALQLPGVSGSYRGAYSCEYWTNVYGREIPSQRSQPISITVTDPPPQPELSVDPPSGTVKKGLSLNITCTVPGGASEQRFHFYKDGAEIIPGLSGFQISSTDPGIISVNTSVLSILNTGPNNTGEYTCRYKKNVSGRWVLSLGSRAMNITMSGINTGPFHRRDILLLATGGILLLAGILAAVICCFRRKKRGQKLQESTKGSEGRECTSNLDPSHDNKGSKAMNAGAEQREQGSEVTYALIPLSALEAHTTQSKTEAQPAEEEHVLYSKVVKKHVQKPDK